MKKTITLSDKGGPVRVICPGHIGRKIFNNAFKAEGWSSHRSWTQKELTYEYWKKTGNQYRLSSPDKQGAKRFTVANWNH